MYLPHPVRHLSIAALECVAVDPTKSAFVGVKLGSTRVQAYLILDEFILAGELQESSKHVILERISMLDMLDLS